jgi:Tfp pilus assembly protein PilO
MLLVVQTPAPDIPLPPPESMSGPVALLLALVVMSAAVLLFGPLLRAVARRIDGRHRLDPAIHEELDQLRARVADVDALNQRVAELEERVDFTERMLAQRATPERLPEGR